MFVSFLVLVVCLQYHVTYTLGFSCVAETMRCATERTGQISSNMNQFYFKSACLYYKAGLDCLYELQNQNAACRVINYPEDFRRAKSKLYGVTSGLCGVDGSIDGCAYGANNCLQHVQRIKDKTNNATCSEYIKMSDCVELLRDRRSCPQQIETPLFDKLHQLKTQLQMECFRTCDLALELCVTDVPLNLTYDPKITEGEQEVLCAELETAIDCMNTTDIEDLCEQDKKTAKWEEALQTQTSNYKTFCSIPAKTCIAELRSCSTEVDAIVATGISTPQDVTDLCLEFERAIECVNRTSLGDYCQGKTGARTLATILTDHKGEMDTYCGFGQCKWAYPACYDLINEVRLKVSQAPQTLACLDVTLGLACANTMKTYDPCHILQFDNVTFDNAVLVLKDYKSALCVDEEQEKPSECEAIFPKCYTSMVKAEQSARSCSEEKQRRTCLKQLTISIACRDSPHAQKFRDLRKADVEFFRKNCVKPEITVTTPVVTDEPDLKVEAIREKEPDAAIVSCSSILLLLTSLLAHYLITLLMK